MLFIFWCVFAFEHVHTRRNNFQQMPADEEEMLGGVFRLVVSRNIRIQGTTTEKRVFLAQGTGIPSRSTMNVQDVHCFSIRELGIEYVGFCDDFGPMNVSAIVGFASSLQSKIVKHRGD